MGWANRVTLARAVMTLAVWVLVAAAAAGAGRDCFLWAFWIFVVAAVTDALDGLLARYLSEVSVFGRIADPLVDKMLVLGTAASLLGAAGSERFFPGWCLALMVTRELLVTALRAAMEARGADFGAVSFGKAKMVLQCVATGACLLALYGTPWILEPLPLVGDAWGRGNLPFALVLLATAVTVASGFTYALRARAALRGA
jgi:CDP-diacylglycerol--glycerol-3-phosphate 3-phosphatidyltransferase